MSPLGETSKMKAGKAISTNAFCLIFKHTQEEDLSKLLNHLLLRVSKCISAVKKIETKTDSADNFAVSNPLPPPSPSLPLSKLGKKLNFFY
jgi:hypothetical protein